MTVSIYVALSLLLCTVWHWSPFLYMYFIFTRLTCALCTVPRSFHTFCILITPVRVQWAAICTALAWNGYFTTASHSFHLPCTILVFCGCSFTRPQTASSIPFSLKCPSSFIIKPLVLAKYLYHSHLTLLVCYMYYHISDRIYKGTLR